jgi:molybdopterin molybdotransferase
MSLPGCDDLPLGTLTVEEALEAIQQQVHAVRGVERIALRGGLDRVLAEPVTAPRDVPPHRNSAMDGYALRADDLPDTGEVTLGVTGESFAGAPYAGTVKAGECVRIMTGAVVPEGADTVVMQEQVHRKNDQITLTTGHTRGQNIRHPGEDMKQGATVLEPGRLLNAADIGLLASMGFAEVSVLRKPRVVFFSTGDELKGIGEPLGEGDIYDSNRYTLHALLSRMNIEMIDQGVIPDDPEAVRRAFSNASELGDLVITSGGVSVGEADYVKQTLDELGEVGFWKIAMKPGKPLAFGRLGQAWFFGLPGNPVSTMATFALFVRPALQIMKGARVEKPLSLRARLVTDVKKTPGRKDYQRGILSQAENGQLSVSTTGLQESHVLSSMSKANCFIVLPRESGPVAAGAEVEVIPFMGIL